MDCFQKSIWGCSSLEKLSKDTLTSRFTGKELFNWRIYQLQISKVQQMNDQPISANQLY